MGSREVWDPADLASTRAAGIVEALEAEKHKIGPTGIWYDWHRDWLEIIAEVAHRWGAPDADGWIYEAGSDRQIWNATARRQATIWTVDPDAVVGERSLSFFEASRISLDPIAAGVRAGVESRLTPLWYSLEMPHILQLQLLCGCGVGGAQRDRGAVASGVVA